MIDLHLHTTASDGHCAPVDLVGRVHAAGVTTFAITDHDTVAGTVEARPHAEQLGLTLVPGIEITAVWGGRDVHVLGYWIDVAHAPLQVFLESQRGRRVERLHAIGAALQRAGVAIDLGPLLQEVAARPGASIGRPAMARALVEAGHVASVQDAFDLWLGEGRPGYVLRQGLPPEEICAVIHAAGGLASLAHPAVTRRDEMISAWAQAGLDALEVFHSDHDQGAETRYLAQAAELGLAVSGGSDFHGDPGSSRWSRRVIGGASLPDAHFQHLRARVPERAA
ncbi:MAG: PHP domain-containing protein [Acidobacteriota bacterium]